MTKGPLIPLIVLYLMRGVTRNDDDSRGSPMAAVVEGLDGPEAGDGDREMLDSNCRAGRGCVVAVGRGGWSAAELLLLELEAKTSCHEMGKSR